MMKEKKVRQKQQK